MRRQVISITLFLILLVGIVVFSFTFFDAQNEEADLTEDLERRSLLVAESLRESIEPFAVAGNDTGISNLVDRFSDRERLLGLLVYDSKEKLIVRSSVIADVAPQLRTLVSASMDEDESQGEFVRESALDERLYLFALPLHDDESVIGSLVVVHNAAYIDTAVRDVWINGLFRFVSYGIILTISLFALSYWLLSRPMRQLIETVKSMQNGSDHTPTYDANHIFFSPIINEISSIHKNLLDAQSAASYEAKLRLEEQDSPWTAERLKEFTKESLKDRSLYIVSNREPYIHIKKGNSYTVIEPASGMVTALNPIMKACGGVWVAHGSGSADKHVVDSRDKVKVPPGEEVYDLKRVWLTEREEQGYYYGFSNSGLWPLCHAAFVEPQFREKDFAAYKKVNEKFANSILREIRRKKNPLIFIQDYHFTLLPKLIKQSRPDATVALFWHIPWPSPESFRICPWRKTILEGLLGADLLAFHTQLHCNNFIDTVRKELEALIDTEQFAIQKNGHLSYIKPFPISVEFSDSQDVFSEKINKESRDEFFRKIGVTPTGLIGVGVDRMDYTKGIVERFLALERFFEKYPSYRGVFTFIQVAPPTRQEIQSYMRFSDEVKKQMTRINKRFKRRNWVPIVMVNKHQDKDMVNMIYKACDICLVTSLHDGMNLVSKEFIAARTDNAGVLILSKFAGASRELKEALLINPFDIEGTADAIREGLEMSKVEQQRRMELLRKTVRNNNIYRWAAVVLKAMIRIEPK